jgi:hypothetical protein
MKIDGYIMSNPDEITVLPDAINSLAKFCDRIFITDGALGGGTLNQHPTYTQPLQEWMQGQFEVSLINNTGAGRYDGEWMGVPITVWENQFIDPGSQRNWTLDKMSQEPDSCDWIMWLDSDEICTNEFIGDVRIFLKDLPSDVSNVCPKWFTLIEDQQHYTPSLSSYLSHSRLHHPGTVRWSSSWHENQTFIGRRVNFDRYIVHSRLVLRKRLLVQRGHKVINEGAWANVSAVPVPDNVTWKMTWPDDEPIGVPFSEDIRNYLKD